ncbi:MAG: Fe-S cluster assembly protein SufB [Patescibacteria group bacterium]
MPPELKTITKETYKYGFSKPDVSVFKTKKGLDEDTIREISRVKGEPDWMLDFRLRSFKIFQSKPMPNFGADLSGINFDDIFYYIKPSDRQSRSWDDVPDSIRDTFDKLGIPEAEREFLAGVGAQYDSEVIYHSLRKSLKEQGVVFSDPSVGLKEHEEIFRKYFGTVIPASDNKFAALNSAVWSGGSFVYIPKGVQVAQPLQAYFRINAEKMGQFERTLIIAEEGSYVHYVEGCTAPIYSTGSLHSAVVEIIVKPGARVRYTTVQNWSNNVYNLVTKRAQAYKNATMEWVDGNIGSKVTMKYPSIFLMEEGARGEIMSLAFAGDGQHQDAGGKVIHLAPNTSSVIISKSISQGNGRASYRGLVRVNPKAENTKVRVECDALLLDEASRTDTYPTMDIRNDNVRVEHEASVSKIGEDQLFYLQQRGLSPAEARGLIVNGFIEPIVKEIPMEYAVELNRLIELEMEGSVG